VSHSLTGQATTLTPASPQSINNGSSVTPTISFKMDNGNKTAMLTTTVVVNGATYTVTLTASSS
jgi:hypothetical protein